MATVRGHSKGLDDLEIETFGGSWLSNERFGADLGDLTAAEDEDAHNAGRPRTLVA